MPACDPAYHLSRCPANPPSMALLQCRSQTWAATYRSPRKQRPTSALLSWVGNIGSGSRIALFCQPSIHDSQTRQCKRTVLSTPSGQTPQKVSTGLSSFSPDSTLTSASCTIARRAWGGEVQTPPTFFPRASHPECIHRNRYVPQSSHESAKV